MSPQRTCIGCRRQADQATLVRLVAVAGTVVDGTSPRLPGRGAYLHPCDACLDLALRRRAIHRALRAAPAGDDETLASLRAGTPGWNQTPSAG